MGRKSTFHLAPRVILSHSSYRELNIKVRQGEILNKIARESNIRTPVEQVLRSIAPELAQVIHFTCFKLIRKDFTGFVAHDIQVNYKQSLDEFAELLNRAITKNSRTYLSNNLLPADSNCPVSVAIIPIVRNDRAFGALFISYQQPVTISPQTERFLAQLADQIAVSLENVQLYEEVLQAEIEKLSLVGELAAGAAHEIRNPLTSIRGFVQILQCNSVKNPSTKDYFPIVLSEIDRIEQIIRELLLLAKPFKHRWVKGSIKDLLLSIALLIESQAHLNDILLQMHFAQDLPDVYMDPDQLKQVFLNIIQNAIEAMPNGGKLIIKVKYSYGFITVDIRDTGVGIPADSLKQIFHPFYTTKDKEKGTGLGLSISSRIIQSFGGTLEVKSHVGRGSTFSIRLPNAT